MTDDPRFEPHPWERVAEDPHRQSRDLRVHPYDRQEVRVCSYLRESLHHDACGADPVGFLIASHAVLTNFSYRRQRRKIEEMVTEQLCALEALTEEKDIARVVAEYRSAETAAFERYRRQLEVQKSIAQFYKEHAGKLKLALDKVRAELATLRSEG